jgi:flagellar basal-body rod protein FlgF
MSGYGENILVRSLGFLAEKQAAIANNLANVDTTSFKRRVAIAEDATSPFQTLLDQKLPAMQFREQTDHGRGIIRETGNRLDIALDGPSWLRVADSQGRTFYTRNGELQVNPQGQLSTRSGQLVLDQGGAPIAIGNDISPSALAIAPNGTIKDTSTDRTLGVLGLVNLPRPEALTPIGGSLYIDPENQRTTPAADGLQQGFLEGSNVDSLQELVQMIAVERSFAASQKALSGLGRVQESIIANILR